MTQFSVCSINAGQHRFRCPHCPKQFVSDQGLYSHVYQNHKEGSYECPMRSCDFVAKYRNELAKHQYHEHNTATEQKCPQPGCGKRFRLKTQLKLHMKSHQQQQSNEKQSKARPVAANKASDKPRYRCMWKRCEGYSSLQKARVIKHIVDHMRNGGQLEDHGGAEGSDDVQKAAEKYLRTIPPSDH